MAILTQACLENLKNKIDLIDLLSSYVELKRTGGYYKACCPFHKENSPSFVVQSGTSHYHCFGCQAHGDAIAFLMQHLSLSFTEAVELLAERYQVPLEYEDAKDTGVNKSRLLDVLNHANQFFHHYLIESEEGKEALAYLEKREIDLNFIKTFEIGLAPRNGSLFIEHMKKKQISLKELAEVALLNDHQGSFFFDRITFPIRDPRGCVIAFSARLYKEGGKGGKYINSRESLLFKKSYVFFGLNYSRMRMAKQKRVLIVEGQIDALRLISHGLNATVAPLGTALTEAHVEKLIQLGIESAYLAFDSDEAGINAAIKSGNLLQKKGISTFIVSMPKNSDPDQILREEGIEGFRALLKVKKEYLSFLLEISSKRVDLSDPANKARIIDKIAAEIKKWENPVLVYESLKKLAEIANIPESTLGLAELQIPHIYSSRKVSSKQEDLSPHQYLEADLLTWLLQSDLEAKDSLKIAQKNLKEDHFYDPHCREIFKVLLTSLEDSSSIDNLSLLMKIKDPKTQKLTTDLLGKKINKEQFNLLFKEAIQRLLDRNWMNTREAIKVKIQSGTLSDQEAIELAKEFDRIQKQRPQVL